MNLSQAFSHWKQVRDELFDTMDKFSEAELLYKPFPSSWTVGEIMLHIVDTEDGWIRYVVTRELKKWPKQYTIENYPTIKEIKSALEAVHLYTLQYLESQQDEDPSRLIATPSGEDISLLWIVWHVIEHEIHHRGELSLILGMLGREGLDV
jgi:uncharacterized damage-inducible protein DinB